ncbi:hypothetical protein KEM54_006156, partial [Ascosphaera aggregata]
VEYAVKAVENGGTAIGIKCKDGVILAVEKIVVSKLLKPGANKRIATVDRNIGIVSAGLIPDGRHFASRAREEASSWRNTYKGPIPTSVLASRLGGYAQAYTLYSSVRPFGVASIIGGWDSEAELPVDGQVGHGPSTGAGGKVGGVKAGGPALYMIEPSGLYWILSHDLSQPIMRITEMIQISRMVLIMVKMALALALALALNRCLNTLIGQQRQVHWQPFGMGRTDPRTSRRHSRWFVVF